MKSKKFAVRLFLRCIINGTRSVGTWSEIKRIHILMRSLQANFFNFSMKTEAILYHLEK